MPTPSQSTYTLVSPPTPGLDPPPGVIPTFHQPYTLRPYAELTIALGIIITTCLVMARIFVKARVVRKFLWEDYTCILGWLAYLAYVSIELHDHAHNGRGTHQWNLPLEAVRRNQYDSNYADIILCIAFGSIKVSILLLITRIFLAVQRNVLFWLTQLLMFANGGYYIAALFLNIFACNPREKIWNPDTPGKCLALDPLYISAASFNTVSDVLMLAVPIIIVWKLQINTRRKVGIIAIFATGLFATICAVTRVYFQRKLRVSSDYTFIHSQTGLLCYGEVAGGIIVSCLPLIPLCWHHLSHPSASRGTPVALGPMNGSRMPNKATNRGTHEAYSPSASINGGTWVQLDDGTRSTAPIVVRPNNDEEALDIAIAGYGGGKH